MRFTLFQLSLIRCAFYVNLSTSNNLDVNNDLAYNSGSVFSNNYDNVLFNNTIQNQGYQGTSKQIKLPFNIENINDTGTFHNQLDSIEVQVADFLKNIKQITEITELSNVMIGVQESNEIITLKDYLTHFTKLQQVIEIQVRNANLCYNDSLKIELLRKNLEQIVSI